MRERWITGAAMLVLVGCGRIGFDHAPDGGDGWTQIADIDAAQGCPGDWLPLVDPIACVNGSPDLIGGVRTAEFAAPFAYTEVKGYVQAYQFGTTDGFTTIDLDGRYLDGMSITYSDQGARRHVWSYSIGWSNANFTETYNHCPCSGGRAAPSFVGTDFYCASGHNDATGRPEGLWFLADPLFDGASPGAGCDIGGQFVTTLPVATESPLEVRLMIDQDTGNEDIGVYRMELYVR